MLPRRSASGVPGRRAAVCGLFCGGGSGLEVAWGLSGWRGETLGLARLEDHRKRASPRSVSPVPQGLWRAHRLHSRTERPACDTLGHNTVLALWSALVNPSFSLGSLCCTTLSPAGESVSASNVVQCVPIFNAP